MPRKLLIVLVNTDPRNPEELGTASSMASGVKPARMVPLASGSYQIWLSRS